MEIFITNDDGWRAKGIHVMAEIMSNYGNVTVIAPEHVQSGMSMAVDIGGRIIEYRKLSQEEAGSQHGNWASLDARPASCVKFAINTCYEKRRCDMLISGINHGSNAATASCYSGTLGAAEEGTLNGIPSIGVSIDTADPDADFSAVKKYFPIIYEKLAADLPERNGIYYNVNFPAIPAEQIKGVRIARMGLGRWVRELKKQDGGEDGSTWVMVGDFMDDPANHHSADHLLLQDGYISIVAHQLDSTDYVEIARLQEHGFDIDF